MVLEVFEVIRGEGEAADAAAGGDPRVVGRAGLAEAAGDGGGAAPLPGHGLVGIDDDDVRELVVQFGARLSAPAPGVAHSISFAHGHEGHRP